MADLALNLRLSNFEAHVLLVLLVKIRELKTWKIYNLPKPALSVIGNSKDKCELVRLGFRHTISLYPWPLSPTQNASMHDTKIFCHGWRQGTGQLHMSAFPLALPKFQLPTAPLTFALIAKSALAWGQRDSEAEELRILAGRFGRAE